MAQHRYTLYLFFILLHVGALIAFVWFFDCRWFLSALGLWQLFTVVGLSVGYHRQICHRSLTTPRLVLFWHLLCGLCAGQGGPLTWAKVHRAHHAESDGDLDPHSPHNDGFWTAHLAWLIGRERRARIPLLKLEPRDLLGDRMIVVFERFQMELFVGMLALLFLFGGWPALLWWGAFRICLTLHTAWTVNSIGHLYGYRNFETNDRSHNLKWLAWISGGEGYHNNHHRAPTSARVGMRTGEVDFGWIYISTLMRLGLAEVRGAPKLRALDQARQREPRPELL